MCSFGSIGRRIRLYIMEYRCIFQKFLKKCKKRKEVIVFSLIQVEFNYSYILISILVEIFSIKIGALMIDKSYFGRKNSMIIFYFLSAVSNLLTYFFPHAFLYLATISKVFMGINIIFCFQYTSESTYKI